jgi:hypothetical protein
MREAQKASGRASKKQTVEEALRLSDCTGSMSRRRLRQMLLAWKPSSQPQRARGQVIVVDSSGNRRQDRGSGLNKHTCYVAEIFFCASRLRWIQKEPPNATD